MQSFRNIDQGQAFDWGRASADYGRYRQGPPDSFYERLKTEGVGLQGQRILDLGTGTGVLARRFARQGAVVSGIDLSAEQIAMARKLAGAEGVSVDFRVSPAETPPFDDHSFDAVTANQCWLYFDKTKVIPAVRRLLASGGILVKSHYGWLPRQDPIAQRTEELVFKYNPSWSSGNWEGDPITIPDWAREAFTLRSVISYDESLPFTRETWRGRIRACRGVGAALPQEGTAAFDAEHEALLRQIAPEQFMILHRIQAYLLSCEPD